VITIYNIRGTNGSGKSTLARSFIAGDPKVPPNQRGVPDSPIMVDLTWYDAPTSKDPARRKSVEGYCSPSDRLNVLVVGSYRTACGGLDAVPDFGTSFNAIDGAIRVHQGFGRPTPEQAIIAEGVLSSTVWGSWGEYAKNLRRGEARLAFCYLDTPLEVCLERIRRRQEAAGKVRDIKTQLVKDKIKAIAATREKALAAGHAVYDLPFETSAAALAAIMTDEWLDCPGVTTPTSARELYRARA
jgi:hypothetical protein